jgi:hypothetical protein
MTLSELLGNYSEDIVEYAYDAYWKQWPLPITASNYFNRDEEDDRMEKADRDLFSWCYEWIISHDDDSPRFEDGFTEYEEKRIDGICGSFVMTMTSEFLGEYR